MIKKKGTPNLVIESIYSLKIKLQCTHITKNALIAFSR